MAEQSNAEPATLQTAMQQQSRPLYGDQSSNNHTFPTSYVVTLFCHFS